MKCKQTLLVLALISTSVTAIASTNTPGTTTWTLRGTHQTPHKDRVDIDHIIVHSTTRLSARQDTSAKNTWSLRSSKYSYNGQHLSGKKQKHLLFGAHGIRFGNIKAAHRLKDSFENKHFGRDLVETCKSRFCRQNVPAFIANLKLTKRDFLSKLDSVNRFVNQTITYRNDHIIHRKLDHWSLASETLARQTGDCEDFAILKMRLLEQAGVPANAMHIVVLRDTASQEYHAVLAVRTNVGYFVLDNQSESVVSSEKLQHYVPLYSISKAGNKIYAYETTRNTGIAGAFKFSRIVPGEKI